MPPLASLAVSMAVIGLTEAVEGDAHETHRDFPASALRRRPSLSPPTAAPNPCIKSLSQGGTSGFVLAFSRITWVWLSVAPDPSFHTNCSRLESMHPGTWGAPRGLMSMGVKL
jgi:hypothetical protein